MSNYGKQTTRRPTCPLESVHILAEIFGLDSAEPLYAPSATAKPHEPWLNEH